jgi:hypothetical protein
MLNIIFYFEEIFRKPNESGKTFQDFSRNSIIFCLQNLPRLSYSEHVIPVAPIDGGLRLFPQLSLNLK